MIDELHFNIEIIFKENFKKKNLIVHVPTFYT